MRPTWLFEADVFGGTAEPLKAEVRRQGMACHVTRQDLLAKSTADSFGGRRLPPDACVVCFGCFPFVNFVLSHRTWAPGAWCIPANLACATYYTHFGPYLLNQRRLILPGIDAVRDRDSIFEQLGRSDRVFVRPDGCQKLFTGRVVCRSAFADALAPTRYDPATLVVVAEPRPIAREWRLVVADGAVIAGSQYLREGRIELAPGFPEEVKAFADRMLAEVKWRPDELFMLDVCESEGGLYLLEINGFSSSALYPCDYEAVVRVTSELAERGWERRNPT